jgi:glycosyltransferase involved in cell wall biosynthesis
VADDGILSDALLRELMAVGEVDILVGVTTYNNASTIQEVMQSIQAAFVTHFPRQRTALIAADGGSRDGTLRLIRETATGDFQPVVAAEALRTLHNIVVPYHGAPGRRTALRTIFAAAELSRAKACAVVGGDAGGLTPEWIDRLVRPVYRDGYDFVAPLYRRHRFDGLLLTNLLYPMMRALYGVRIREPLSAEYGVSARLAGRLIGNPAWDTELGRVGIDLWLTAAAAAGGFRACEAVLGPRLSDEGAGGPALAALIQQVVGSLFTCLEMHADFWRSPRPETVVPVVGSEENSEPEPTRINRRRMFDRFRSGVVELADVLRTILAPETFDAVSALARHEGNGLHYPDDLWVRTVYDLAASYHNGVMRREHLLMAITPLYLGRAGSFVFENLRRPHAEVERGLEELCAAFANLRPYLLERWEGQAPAG